MQNFTDAIPAHVLNNIKDLNLNIRSKNCHEAINDLLQRTVLLGGKRIRPMLTFLFANLFNVDAKKIDSCASGIEMVHAASLAHDDVIDNATTRRGNPSINIVESNKRAVLAGDYLLSDVIALVAQTGSLKLVEEIAAVIQDLSAGEWYQLDAAQNREYSREIIEEIAVKKTASVMGFCCFSSAYLAELDEEIIDFCRQIGFNIGVAFQLIDDTLDFSGDSQKDHQLDLQNGIVNAVVYEWLLLNPEKLSQFEKGEALTEVVVDYENDESMKKAIQIIQDNAISKLEKASNLLGDIKSKLNLDALASEKYEEARAPIDFIIAYLAARTH